MYIDGLSFQDSRMATCNEFIDDLNMYDINDTTNTWKGGPILFRDNNKIYIDGSEAHSLIVGDTGSMKTLRYVLPLIYSCSRAEESMIIVDPKGELSNKMASYLKRNDYKTVIINLRNPHSSPDQWNPFGRIHQAFKSKNSRERENAEMLLNDLLNILFFSRSSAEKDQYWNESAGQFALGICELIENIGDELNIANILKWRHQMLNDGTLKKYFEMLSPDSSIYQNLAGCMLLKAENTKSCILSTFDQLFRVFNASSSLTKMLSDSTFNFNRIIYEKTAIFLIVPDEKTTFHFLATLFVNQCYEMLVEQAENFSGKLPRRINFILEEFCNMPKIADIISMLTAARSRNIRFHLVVQSYEQMIDKYDEHICKTIMDNCGNLIYLHSRELSFLQYISSLSGENKYEHPLLSVSRLQRIMKNETLIFHDRCYPYMVKDVPLIFEYPVQTYNKIENIYITA